ncbi:hypothetical protein ACXOKJ_03020 [Streptococcus thermophilus]
MPPICTVGLFYCHRKSRVYGRGVILVLH